MNRSLLSKAQTVFLIVIIIIATITLFSKIHYTPGPEHDLDGLFTDSFVMPVIALFGLLVVTGSMISLRYLNKFDWTFFIASVATSIYSLIRFLSAYR